MNLSRLGRFLVVGASAVAVNLLLFWLFIGWLGLPYPAATVLVFALGTVYGFAANRRLVFGVTDRPWRRLVGYAATMAVSLGLNLASMGLLIEGARLTYPFASMVTSLVLMPLNYFAHGKVAFRTVPGRGLGEQRDLAGATPERGPTERSVLLVTHYYPAHGGGVEIVAGQLARRLCGELQVEWHAAAPSGGSDRPGDPMTSDIVVRPMHCWNGFERLFGLPMPLPSPRSALAVIRAARSMDIVWVHDLIYPANLVAALTAIAAQKPLVVTAHVGPIPYRNRLVRGVMAATIALTGRFILTRAAAVAFVSERVRTEFRARWRLRDARLIPNGVDVGTFKPSTQAERDLVRNELGLGDHAVVLFVGRFVERKGLRLLHELARQMPSIEWVFAGRGPLDPSSWGLPNVHVEKERAGRGIAELYGAADLLALPSLGEGFPLVVAEALAAGLAVLVDPSTVAGYEAVAEVTDCEPVGGRDAVSRWAARVTEVLGRDADRTVLAARRVEFARRHWDWDRAAARYRELFVDVVGEARPPLVQDR